MTDEALTGVREEQSRSCHSFANLPPYPAVWDKHALIYHDYNSGEREVCLFLCVIDGELENDWSEENGEKWEKRRYTGDDRYGCNKQYVMMLLKYQADKTLKEYIKSVCGRRERKMF